MRYLLCFLVVCIISSCDVSVNGNTIEGWTYDIGTSEDCDGTDSGTGLCGPEHWGNLEGAESCGADTSQSPMNLAQAVITNQVPDIHFDYESGCSEWTQGANDHNFNIKFDPYCRNLTMTILDEKFYLDSLHLHSPSEHTIGGGRFAAEAHLLHYSFTSDAIVYVAILLEQTAERLPFTNNSFLDGLWNARTVSEIASENIISHDRKINPYEDLFPGTYSHFNYKGSLTTPPCTPGARWFIFDTPVPISDDDLRIIRDSIGSVPDSKRSQQGNTNRPVQPKNGRQLYYSYGINSNSAINVQDTTCDCDEDIQLAKIMSIIAAGVSASTLLLIVFGYSHMMRNNNTSSKNNVPSVECKGEERSVAVPDVSSNPLYESRPPSKDSVL